MTLLKLNQRIKKQIDELKLLATKSDTSVIFILDEAPFNTEEEMTNVTKSQEHVIIGRIFLNSDIFREGVYKIEIKLPELYPFDPPQIRFMTSIYHPNVNSNGEFHHEILQKTAQWTLTTSLLDVVKASVKRIDEPNIEYSRNPEVANEYIQNRTEFNRKALEMVNKYALPRN